MPELNLERTEAGYAVNFGEALIGDEPVVLRRNGEVVGAIVPAAVFEAFQAWRAAEARAQHRRQLQTVAERERAVYLQMEEQLRADHAGRFVAIQGGRVVDSDEDELALLARVDAAYPDTPVYVRQVGVPPRIERVPTPLDLSPRP
jgi:hypothetical protein